MNTCSCVSRCNWYGKEPAGGLPVTVGEGRGCKNSWASLNQNLTVLNINR